MSMEKNIAESIFNNSNYIVTLKDENLCYLKCSKAFFELVKIDCFEGLRQEQLVLCKNYKEISNILNSVIKDKIQKTFVQTVYINGCEYHYQSTAIPILAKGKPVKILTISQNITESVSMQKHFEKYINTLRHDLQISAIEQTRALQLLLEGHMGDFNSEQQEFLELLFHSCNHVYSIVKQTLAAQNK